MLFSGFLLQFFAGTILCFVLLYFRDKYKLPKFFSILAMIFLLGTTLVFIGFMGLFVAV